MPKAALFLVPFFSFTLAAFGQQPTPASPAGNATALSGVDTGGSPGGPSLTLAVLDQKAARLDYSATVRLYDETSKQTRWLYTSDKSEATFEGGRLGTFDFDVNAYGYLPGHKELKVVNEHQPVKMQIVLHPDPDAVVLKGPDSSAPAKAAKDATKGIAELKAGHYKEAQKHLQSYYDHSPASANANFLLAYVYFQQNDFDHAQNYLTEAAKLDANDVEVLNLMGRLKLARKDFAGAKQTFQEATTKQPDNATSHSLLADAYFNLGDYKSVLVETEAALKSNAEVGNAQILRGQALANLGRNGEALTALNAYLQGAPDTAAVPQVTKWVDILEQRRASSHASPAPK